MTKLLHISDLHIGKRVNEFPMLEDQEYILKEILHIIDDEQPDGIIIAGDVYDRSMPSDEAVRLLGDFLGRLAARHIETYIISGNHDSAAKLAFASELIDLSGIHIAPEYNGQVVPFENNGVRIYMLPFIKPASVRSVFPDEADEIRDYTDACRVAISHMDIDEGAVNVLVAHQFVTGAERSESEDVNVGGLDNVDASVFDAFDYVALGHIHGPQSVGRPTIRYSGTPLKYSFSESSHEKSVTVIEVGSEASDAARDDKKVTGSDEDGRISIRTRRLTPLHDMREIRGTCDELREKSFYEGTDTDDYIHAILTDEEEVPEAISKLRVIYPNIMKLSYDNKRSRSASGDMGTADVENKNELELIEEFYENQNNQPMTAEQRDYVIAKIEELKEG